MSHCIYSTSVLLQCRAPSSSVIIVCTFLDAFSDKDKKTLATKYRAEIIQRYGIIGHVKAGYPIIRDIAFVSAVKNDKAMNNLRNTIFNTACRLEETACKDCSNVLWFVCLSVC